VSDRGIERAGIVRGLDLVFDEEVLTHGQGLQVRLAAARSPERRVVLSLLLLGQHMAGWDLVAFDQTARGCAEGKSTNTTRSRQSLKCLHGLALHRKPSRSSRNAPAPAFVFNTIETLQSE